ncbi:hypothetical protein BG003_009122 [Podila horticola]|nr:hypothetical protein BG003_009122 [Podila horticola]
MSDNNSPTPALRSAPGRAALVNSVSSTGVITVEGTCVSDRRRPLTPSGQTYGGVNKNLESIPDCFLGPKDALGREDIVYKPSHDIAIKARTTADPLVPMSSVPHDWSWSTF